MNTKRRSNNFEVMVCTAVVFGFLICSVPVLANSHATIDDCSLRPHDGDCGSRLTLSIKFYYDTDMDMCTEFLYFGCGGNNNRFNSFEECEELCVFGSKK